MPAGRIALAGAAVATTMAMTATAVASSISVADPGSMPDARTTSSGVVEFRPGPRAGKVEITSTDRRVRTRALALVGISVHAGHVRLPRRIGTDFDDPSVWRAIRAGDLCWAEESQVPSASYTVRDPEVPFPAPPGSWRWSTIVVYPEGAVLPVIRRSPSPGDVFAMNAPIRRVIACVTPRTTHAGTSVDRQRAEPASKVTICHRTNSPSNPYNRITVDEDAIVRQGHDGHTGPLFPEPDWGDVIPPFPGYPGMNWPAGQGLLDNDCQITAPPVEPPVEVIPPDPTLPPVVVDPPIVIDPPKPDPTPTPSPTAPTPTSTATVTASVAVTAPTSPVTTASGTSQPSTQSPPTSVTAPSPTSASGTVITQPPAPEPSLPPAGEIDFQFSNGWALVTVTVDWPFLRALLQRSGPCGTGRAVRSLPMGC